MGVNNPERAFFWDDGVKEWRKAVYGEAGEFVWDTTTNAWVKGTLGAEYVWNDTTKSWDKGALGGQYKWNDTTKVWDKNTAAGGGRFYWDETSKAWVKNLGGAASAALIVKAAGGALYDPSDLTSIYKSRTGGSTGAADAVVGIMLDKSYMGGASAASFIAGQSNAWSDGAAQVTGEAQALGGGAYRIYSSAGASAAVRGPNSAVVQDRFYQVKFTIDSIAVLGAGVRVGDYGENFTTTGAKTTIWRAESLGWFFIKRSSGATDIQVSNLQIREIPGYHALAPSDAARPILRQANGLSYLETDGVDDWMNVFPTLNLGETWWHVGGWLSSAAGDAPFATSNQEQSALSASGKWTWYDTSSTQADLASATITSAHVLTVEQASASALSGRINGATGSTIDPYDGSTPTKGLALFSRENDAFAVGLAGRFYGGAFAPGSLSAADRALMERFAAQLSGVTF